MEKKKNLKFKIGEIKRGKEQIMINKKYIFKIKY